MHASQRRSGGRGSRRRLRLRLRPLRPAPGPPAGAAPLPGAAGAPDTQCTPGLLRTVAVQAAQLLARDGVAALEPVPVRLHGREPPVVAHRERRVREVGQEAAELGLNEIGRLPDS